MIKHNRLISASVVLMLIFAMPGMPDLVTKVYAASSVSELLKNLDENPIFRYSDTLPHPPPPRLHLYLRILILCRTRHHHPLPYHPPLHL